MSMMEALTWVFRAGFLLIVTIGTIVAIRYDHRTDHAWRQRPAGVMLMILICGLVAAAGAVTARTAVRVLNENSIYPVPEWVNVSVLIVSAIGVYLVVVGLAYLWWLVERRQPDYSPKKDRDYEEETMSTGTPNWRRWPFWKDWAERVLWTAAQVALSMLSVEALDLPAWAVLILAPALAAVKGFVASKIGDRGTASTVRLLPDAGPSTVRREHI